MYNSIVEIVAQNAIKNPEKLCIVDNMKAYTYGEIWKLVRVIAKKLRKLDIKKRDCVMVECTQDAHFLICGLACELERIIFVPIEHRASKARVKNILDDVNAKLFIYETEYEISNKTIQMSSLPWMLMEEENTYLFPKAEDTSEILYTTGTTGIAKGIEITNRNNIALAENIKYGTEMKGNNIELIPLPLSHSHGLRCFYANMLNGSTVVLTEGVSQVKHIFDVIEKYKVTAMDMSPSAASILIKLSKDKLYDISRQIDYIQVGTERVQEDIKKLLNVFFPTSRLYNFYGSTESGRSCVLEFSKEKGKVDCIGKPTKNAKFIVTDEERNPINSSKKNIGLLASAGSMNMKGYWRQPVLTEETMRNGYVYTNDMGYIDDEGYIYVLGRKDNIINYRGIKISPEEIEESVKKCEGIIDCACVPKKDDMCGEVPKLFIVVQKKEKFQKKDMLNCLKQYIDENKMPKEIEIVEEIPYTYNGKIHRKKLLEMSL